MKKSYAKKALLLSALSIFLCVAMLAGATFAWFTDSVTSDVTTIIAGVLDIEMEHMNTSTNGVYVDANSAELFEDVEKWEPGVVTVENLKIKNVGDLALEYRLSATFSNANTVVDVNGNDTGKTLADALKIAFLEGETISLPTNDKAAREAVLAKARPLGTPLKETVYEGSLLGYVESTQPTKDVAVVIYWDPTATDNDFNLQNGKTASVGNELKIDLGIKLVATQKDYETDSFDKDYDEKADYPIEAWDGVVDTSWYDATATEYTITDASQLAGLAELVNSRQASFAGKTVKLAESVNLSGSDWTPIGTDTFGMFSGTFDGDGYTIYGLTTGQVDRAYGNGLFGNLPNGAVIKNVTIRGAEVSRYGKQNNVYNGNAYGIVAAYVYGSATFENVHVKDSFIQGFGKIGGIVGMNGEPGNYTLTFNNCSVTNTEIAGVYNVAPFVGLVQKGNKVVTTNCYSNAEWVKSAAETYADLVNEIATEATSGDTIVVSGNYWKYSDYYYTGWADIYSDYELAEYDYVLADGMHIAHGLTH